MSGVLRSYPGNEAPEERHARVLRALGERFAPGTFEGEFVRAACREAAECVAEVVGEREFWRLESEREREECPECGCGVGEGDDILRADSATDAKGV